MAIETTKRMSVAEYLAWEQSQECKHEYIDGEIIEMSGARGRHNRIVMQIAGTLMSQLDMSRHVVFGSDMRVRTGADRYVYPDLSIVRGAEEYDGGELNLLNPVLVVEVTSPSSMLRDRIDKRDWYYQLPSIAGYLIVDQDRIHADLFTRADEGWLLRGFTDAEDVIPLPMLGCELPLAQVYRGIAFEED